MTHSCRTGEVAGRAEVLFCGYFSWYSPVVAIRYIQTGIQCLLHYAHGANLIFLTRLPRVESMMVKEASKRFFCEKKILRGAAILCVVCARSSNETIITLERVARHQDPSLPLLAVLIFAVTAIVLICASKTSALASRVMSTSEIWSNVSRRRGPNYKWRLLGDTRGGLIQRASVEENDDQCMCWLDRRGWWRPRLPRHRRRQSHDIHRKNTDLSNYVEVGTDRNCGC